MMSFGGRDLAESQRSREIIAPAQAKLHKLGTTDDPSYLTPREGGFGLRAILILITAP